jgi:hypothetical protein
VPGEQPAPRAGHTATLVGSTVIIFGAGMEWERCTRACSNLRDGALQVVEMVNDC